MRLEAFGVDGIGEVDAATDLAALVVAQPLADGDVVLITSKVVSKAEGRVVEGDREEAIAQETVRLVARRGPTSIVENHLGLVMAAAGIDASNVQAGHLVLLPLDPDASARAIRARVWAETGRNIAVVVTDTAGRAWRQGQTDIAIGTAGIEAMVSFEGRVDAYGNELAVTAPAIADELSGLSELVTGKLGGQPICIVRGLADAVLPAGQDGAGARVLVRPRDQDMFALGAREAVVAAVRGSQAECFGAPVPAQELLDVLRSCDLDAELVEGFIRVHLGLGSETMRDQVARAERTRILALAHRWRPHSDNSSADWVALSPVR